MRVRMQQTQQNIGKIKGGWYGPRSSRL
jgi:hypothetical protein